MPILCTFSLVSTNGERIAPSAVALFREISSVCLDSKPESTLVGKIKQAPRRKTRPKGYRPPERVINEMEFFFRDLFPKLAARDDDREGNDPFVAHG